MSGVGVMYYWWRDANSEIIVVDPQRKSARYYSEQIGTSGKSYRLIDVANLMGKCIRIVLLVCTYTDCSFCSVLHNVSSH
jgi:hypothetical protein